MINAEPTLFLWLPLAPLPSSGAAWLLMQTEVLKFFEL
jgi:hypothetical protein